VSARPVRLRADNFTPPVRTPWGGTRILERYKAHLGVTSAGVVGESWEVSVEPSFPSRLADEDVLLADVIAAEAEGWLGARSRHAQTPLLVKLLDAASHLSVQVHPTDDDPALAAGESGKPEAWIVLHAQPGAGLYLGFRDGVSRDDVERCLRAGGALDELMQFVPVAPGDAFMIDAGTPHAIGAGVTLLEPQHVAPGRAGVTYRFWDWNRRYDAAGALDPTGEPRALHVERSLAVTAWDRGRGEAFVDTCRARSERLAPFRERVLAWRWFEVERWSGSGSVPAGGLRAITCTAGTLTVETERGELVLRTGESGVVPACAGPLAIRGDGAIAYATCEG
jgi:mannose-6-phosphate isomerase